MLCQLWKTQNNPKNKNIFKNSLTENFFITKIKIYRVKERMKRVKTRLFCKKQDYFANKKITL